MRYLMLVSDDESAGVPVEDTEPTAWVSEMRERGVRQLGSRLRPVSDATTVRVRDGEVLVTDGPFAETKEQIGGFDLLECADLDEAIEVAVEASRREVRPARAATAVGGEAVLGELRPAMASRPPWRRRSPTPSARSGAASWRP